MLTAALLVLVAPTNNLFAPSVPVAITQAETQTGDAYFQQGALAFQAHQYETAIAHWRNALIRYQEQGNTYEAADTLNALVAANLAIRDYETAIAHAQEALTLADNLDDRSLQSRILGNLGIAYLESGQYNLAITTYEQALAIMRSLATAQIDEAQMLGLLGNAYESLGDYDAAIAAQRESITLARSLDANNLVANALLSIGNLHRYQAEYATAIAHYLQGVELARTHNNPATVAYGLNDLGITYQHLGYLDKAIAAHTESLELTQLTQNPSLQAGILLNIGIIQAHNDSPEAARQTYRESVAIARTIDDPRLLANVLNNLAHTLLQTEDFTAAEAALKESITLLNELRQGLPDAYKVTVFDTQIYTYNLLVQVYVAQGNYEAALVASEQGRARALADLATPEADSPSPSLEQIRHIAQTLDATLVEYAIVPDDDFVVQGRQRGKAKQIYIWVVAPNGTITFHEQPLEGIDLAKLVADTRWMIEVPSRHRATRENLAELHRLLIAPIADVLPDTPEQRVVISPHEDLFYVPFPALQDSEEGYLIEQHTLLSTPAIQLLDTAIAPSPQPDSLESLVVGNPTMPSVATNPDMPLTTLSSLPGSETEANAIATLFDTEAILGDAATEDFLIPQMEQANLIHLATHGLLDYIDTSGIVPIAGAIALTPSPTSDGLLTAHEITQLSLKAELVVLSACDTGRGEITGDGVVGLSRSLIAAGARSTVTSLWAVPDEATSTLMLTFYENLRQGQDKDQSLRLAMLTTMEAHPSPLNWAAFSLVGNPDQLR